MRRILLTSLLLLPGCGSASAPVEKPPPATGPGLTQRAGVITATGDVAPEEYGPLRLAGRYRATFTQEGRGVDFAQEVPFTAFLQQGRRRLPLFQTAARTGRTTVTARGRWTLVVDFGDSPFTVQLTPDA